MVRTRGQVEEASTGLDDETAKRRCLELEDVIQDLRDEVEGARAARRAEEAEYTELKARASRAELKAIQIQQEFDHLAAQFRPPPEPPQPDLAPQLETAKHKIAELTERLSQLTDAEAALAREREQARTAVALAIKQEQAKAKELLDIQKRTSDETLALDTSNLRQQVEALSAEKERLAALLETERQQHTEAQALNAEQSQQIERVLQHSTVLTETLTKTTEKLETASKERDELKGAASSPRPSLRVDAHVLVLVVNDTARVTFSHVFDPKADDVVKLVNGGLAQRWPWLATDIAKVALANYEALLEKHSALNIATYGNLVVTLYGFKGLAGRISSQG